ncbi:MAG: M48 family metallopeptidase [Aridibacter sp.]
MFKGSGSRVTAFFLFLAVWFSSVAIMPQNAFAQQNDNKKPNTSNSKGTLEKDEDPSQIGKRNINGGLDKFTGWLGGSREKEIAIGRQLAAQVEQQAKMVEDPMITEYINRVGQNIVLNSDAKIPFTIKVIDSDEVNAFALPGGFFFVNKGLIVAADNEAELAGVMAHEIAHVTARHAMENSGKGTLLNYGLLAGIIFTGGIGGAILQNTAGLTQALAFFKFSRGAEIEADELGVQYLYAAGYDPTAMATMFEKLASKNKKKPGTISKLFTSHPQSVERRDDSLQLAARFPEKEEYKISTSEFQKVKEHLLRISNAGIVSPDDIDNVEDGRPTLKRRQPADTTSPSDSTSPSDDKDGGPPKLKRRNEPTSNPDKDNDN